MDSISDRQLHPLAHPQKRIWHAERLFPGSPLNNLAGTVTYRCALDFERLADSFNLLMRTHDALRLRFVDVTTEKPKQYVAAWEPVQPSFVDFTRAATPRTAFERWVDTLAHTPFVLEGAPLFRVAFFRLSAEECGYFINCHHLVADGWAIQEITRFVSRAYRGESIHYEEQHSYLKFLVEEASYERSARFQRDREFWLRELEAVKLYPAEWPSAVGEQTRVVLPSGRSRWRQYARQLGVSQASICAALLLAFIWKAEQSSDLVVGMPVANRTGPQRNQLGMFASTMPLRARVVGDQSIADLARQVHSTITGGLRHQRYPYDVLIRDLALVNTTPGQLFRACVNVYNTHLSETARIGSETVIFNECYVGQQLFPLYVVVKEWDADDTLEFRLDYKPSVYSRRDVEHLSELLLTIPDKAESTIETLTSQFSLSTVTVSRAVPSSECMVSAGVRAAVCPLFPRTQYASGPRSPSQRASFEPPSALRAKLAGEFGGSDADIDRAITAAVCVLLSRCADVKYVRIGVAKIGGLTDLAFQIDETSTFRGVQKAAGLTSRLSGEAPAYGVVVDLTRGQESVPAASPLTFSRSGVITYDPGLYTRDEIELISARLQFLLEQAASAPDVRVAELDAVPPSERALLLEGFNDTDVAFPDDTTIVKLFEQTAARCPDRIALRGTTETLLYRQLDGRATCFAGVLRKHGVKRGSIVPILLERSPQLLVGIFGILKAGAAYLPIDPAYPRARIDYLLEDSQASLVVSKPGLFEGGPGRVLVDVDLASDQADAVNSNETAGPEDLAYVCYTSGSTGKPKGVMIEHRSLVNRLHWMQRVYPLTPWDVLLQKTSISFDVSVWELFWWTLVGASLCLVEQGDERDPERLTEWIGRHGVTIIHFVPSMLQAFLKHLEATHKANRLRSLRRCFASGEALRPEQVETFNRLLSGAGAKLTNLYGPTEATVDVTYYDCPASGTCERVPIGRPIDNIRLRILDNASKLQPIGVAGELYLGGVGVARGYLNRPEMTSQRFVADPFEAGGRLYRTGDLARWLPNGEVEYLGRNDDQIKIRGHRVELGEIEAVLHEHWSVESAVVNAWRSPHGSVRLCGYVVLRAPCTMQALQEHLSSRLPSYMVPSSLVQIESVPLGATGKLNRAALPPPPMGAENPQPPCTPAERALAEIWQAVLEVPIVGVTDNFFSLGGDSIKVISIVAQARSRGLSITAEEVYRCPTVRALALASTSTLPEKTGESKDAFALLRLAEDQCALPPSAEDAYPLSMLQLGLLYQSRIIRHAPLYHDVFSYRIGGTVDVARFSEAVGALCRNHPMLRTTFHLTGFSEPIQIVHREIPLPLSIADVRGQSPEAQRARFLRDIDEIRRQGRSTDAVRMVGFHLHLLSDAEYLYTIDFHDSALDGWSVNLLHRELFECYYALLACQPSPLRKPVARFRDFVARERIELRRSEHKDFWASVLGGSNFLKLPRRTGYETGQFGGVDFHQIAIDVGLSDAVKELAREMGVPPKSVLLAVHIYVLSLLSGERDVVTGYECGVRTEDIDSEAVIGLFLNTVPLRIDSTWTSWKSLVNQIYQAETEFMPHRHYPMAQMKWDRGAQGPLFETVFNFTHFHVLSGLRRLPGFDLLDVHVRAETEFAFRFECSIHPFSEDLLLWIHYHTGAFPREQIEEIAGYYARALQSLVQDPSRAPSVEVVLGEQELRRQFFEFNSQVVESPAEDCFHHIFEAVAAREPDRIAATCANEAWSYGRLNQRANQLAQAILRQPRRPEFVVGVALPRGLAWVASVIACFKAGAVYLPLDIEHPFNRTQQILQQSHCDILIAESAESYATLARSTGSEILEVARVFETEMEMDNPKVPVSPGNLAYILFTSGSTGLPKGAMLEHAGMLNHLLAKIEDLDLSERDVVAQTASQCFDISIWQSLAALARGGRVAVIGKETSTDLQRFVAAVREEGVSILELVPSYLAALLDGLVEKPRSLDTLRYLLVTGEPVSATLIDRWFDLYPHIPVVNAYGPTEAADDICHHVMTDRPRSAAVPVGKPIRNMRIYVLDEHLKPVPIGAFGEICVSGVGVGRGYVNDPERTSAAFVEDPFDLSRRMYRTGDIGRWSPQGVVELSGRRDEQIKIRGYRVEIAEIEHCLKRCSGIRQAAVVVDATTTMLAAFVVSVEAIDPAQLRRELALNLPEYMVPSRVIRVPRLPLTEHGKIAKQSLLHMLESAEDERASTVAPIGPAEIELSQIWAALLRIDLTRIGRFSHFFELGGDSLKAMQLSLHTQERVSISDVVKFPYLKDLAARLDAAASTQREVLVELSSAVAPSLSIVGFSYAAGSAANFKPLFDEIAARRPDIAGFAVEMPRPDMRGARVDIDETVRVCCEHIRTRIRTPLLLWGHCSGSAPALAVARRLEGEGVDLRMIVLAGKLIASPTVSQVRRVTASALSPFMAVDAASMSWEQIKDWLIRKTAFDGFAGLGEDAGRRVAEAFRHDATLAARFFDQVMREPRHARLHTRILNLVAHDDLLTRGYRRKYRNWRVFSDRVQLCVVPDGGHYFIKTRPKEVTELLLRALERIELPVVERPAPSHLI